MKRFELLEHTADIKMKVYGKSPEELFSNAAYGMACIQNQKSKIKNQNKNSKFKIKRNLTVKSLDLESLLVDFLSEILTLSDTYHEVYSKVLIVKLNKNKVEAEIEGFGVDQFDEDIKAVTYHGLEIKKVDDHWETIVLFDV
jgi:SHS2 domain-containing protein